MGLTLTGIGGTVPVRHRLDRGHTRQLRTVAHDVLDSEYPVVVVMPAASRTGTLRLLLADDVDAAAADDLVAAGGVLQLDDDTDPTRSLRFVALESAELVNDPATGARTVLQARYREVAP